MYNYSSVLLTHFHTQTWLSPIVRNSARPPEADVMRNSWLVVIPVCCFHLSEVVTAGHHRAADVHTHTEVQGAACWGLLHPPTHLNTRQCGLTGSPSALRAPEGSSGSHIFNLCAYMKVQHSLKNIGLYQHHILFPLFTMSSFLASYVFYL